VCVCVKKVFTSSATVLKKYKPEKHVNNRSQAKDLANSKLCTCFAKFMPSLRSLTFGLVIKGRLIDVKVCVISSGSCRVSFEYLCLGTADNSVYVPWSTGLLLKNSNCLLRWSSFLIHLVSTSLVGLRHDVVLLRWLISLCFTARCSTLYS